MTSKILLGIKEVSTNSVESFIKRLAFLVAL